MTDPTTTPTTTEARQDVRERLRQTAALAVYNVRRARTGLKPLPDDHWPMCGSADRDTLAEVDAVLAAVSAAAPDEREAEASLARAITASLNGRTWASLSPLDHARTALAWFAQHPALAARPAPEGHPLDRLCNDPAPTINLPGAMSVPPPTYCARVKGHEPPHAHGDMTWAARPAPTVNAADVEITTAAELDALPAGTIVRDRFGGYLAQGRDAMGVAWFHYPDYDHAGSSALVAGIGPVTVCFTPGLTVADEGRAEA